MTDLGVHPEGATPLDPESLAGLRPSWIATRADLNQAEEEAIAAAVVWAATRRWKPSQLLQVPALQSLHRRMLRPVWKWAGQFRTQQMNIGVDWWQVPMKLQELVDAAAVWVEHSTYPLDEIAVRFHHRLVAIHPFANGNGRHARLVADLLAVSLDRRVFTWGAADLGHPSDVRAAYLRALRTADREFDYQPLLAFARS